MLRRKRNRKHRDALRPPTGFPDSLLPGGPTRISFRFHLVRSHIVWQVLVTSPVMVSGRFGISCALSRCNPLVLRASWICFVRGCCWLRVGAHFVRIRIRCFETGAKFPRRILKHERSVCLLFSFNQVNEANRRRKRLQSILCR